MESNCFEKKQIDSIASPTNSNEMDKEIEQQNLPDSHPDDMAQNSTDFMDTETEHICSCCGRKFSQRKNLYAHMRKFHPDEKIQYLTKSLNVCSLCKTECLSITSLHEHIQKEHEDIKLSFQEKVFYNIEDFTRWKIVMEQETQSFYAVHRSATELADGRSVTHYSCNRSGVYNPKGSGKRHLKCLGTNKIGKMCPAYLTVYKTVVDDITEIKAHFQSVHLGHECEVGRLTLTDSQKNKLASEMLLGIPKETVLNNIQKSFSPTKRISFTNKKDLFNICRDKKIEHDISFDPNDAVSVDLRVKQLMSEEDNPVLLYKPCDTTLEEHKALAADEFILALMSDSQLTLLNLYGNNGVMIDSTHGTNMYGYQLTTLMVNDANHEGFPVAVIFSSRVTTEVMCAFFSEIKKRAPDLKPKFFMSDDDPLFYNAWLCTFGESKYLLCAWHIRRAWGTNLKTKIKIQELREIINKDLKHIIQEQDVVTFENLLQNFMNTYSSNNESKEFCEYFKKYYVSRKELWGYCFRQNSHINTNMKLERWHRELKYEEAGGKVIKRLDKALAIVLSAISKKMIGRLISLERSKLSAKVSLIRKRHKASTELSKNLVTEMEPGARWAIISSKATDAYLFTYEVACETGMHQCSCPIRCMDCNICIHQYSCTCNDYTIRFLICKHIHLVCANFSLKLSSSPYLENNDPTDEENNLVMDISENHNKEEHEAISKELKKRVIIRSFDEEKAALRLELDAMLDKCKSLDQLRIVREVIEAGNARLSISNESGCLFPELSHQTSKQPSNKNIVPQRRLLKVKKNSKGQKK